MELYSFSLLTHPVPFVKHMDEVRLPLLVLKQIISALLDANRIFVFSCTFPWEAGKTVVCFTILPTVYQLFDTAECVPASAFNVHPMALTNVVLVASAITMSLGELPVPQTVPFRSLHVGGKGSTPFNVSTAHDFMHTITEWVDVACTLAPLRTMVGLVDVLLNTVLLGL